MTRVKAEGPLAEWGRAARAKGHVLSAVSEALVLNPTNQERDDSVVHPSAASKADWCERANYFYIKGELVEEQDTNFIRENIFAEGDFIHLKWQKWMRNTGKLWGLWRCQVCLETAVCTSQELDSYVVRDRLHIWDDWKSSEDDPANTPAVYCSVGYGEPLAHLWEYEEIPLAHGLVGGHADGAVDNYLVELKSVGLGTLRMEHSELLKRHNYDLDKVWKDLRAPLVSHLIQGNLYLWMAQNMGLDLDRIAFIYEFKPNQQVKEFDVPLNMRLLQPILDRIEKIEYAIESGIPPECPHGGCKYCAKAGSKSVQRRVAAVSEAAGRDAEGADRDNGSVGRGTDGIVQPASSVGGLHSSDTSGSGTNRKRRRKYAQED